MLRNGMKRFALAASVFAGILLAQPALSADEEGAPKAEEPAKEEASAQTEPQATPPEQPADAPTQIARERAEQQRALQQQRSQARREAMRNGPESRGAPTDADRPTNAPQYAGPWGGAGRESLDRRRAWAAQNRDAWRRLRNPRSAYIQDAAKARRAMMRGLAEDRRANRDAFSPPVATTAPPFAGGPYRPW